MVQRGAALSPTDAAARPLPLRRVYFLEAGDGPVRIIPFPGAEAAGLLLRNLYGLRIAGADDRLSGLFALCQELFRHIRMYRVIRPMDYARLPEVLSIWREHALADRP